MKPISPLATLAEKVIATYIQALIAFLIVHDSLGADVYQTAAIAAVPAALTVIANGLPAIPVGLPFWVDLVLRTVRTYTAAVLGLLLAMPVFHLDFTAAVAALSAGIPAALAVVKGALATRFGNTGTAALLPAKLDAT